MSDRLSDGYPCRGVLHTPLARLSSTPTPFAGRLVGRIQYAPTLPEKDKVSSGWYFPLSRTIRDEYVFIFSMSNRLLDRHPGRDVLNTPLARLSSTLSPLMGRLVGRKQYAPTLPEKKSDFKACCGVMFETRGDEYVFHFSISNRLSDRYPGRAQKHTPLIDSTSTPSPFAGRLVGRMQYAPTFPEKDEVFSGMCFLLSRTMRDQSVFLFSMSNRLSDRYPGRAQKHTLHIDSTSTPPPFAGRLVSVCNTPLHCRKKMRFPRKGVFHRLRQCRINTYFISSCLIGHQMGTHVGAYCIRHLRVYRLPLRPLQGVW